MSLPCSVSEAVAIRLFISSSIIRRSRARECSSFLFACGRVLLGWIYDQSQQLLADLEWQYFAGADEAVARWQGWQMGG